jgi:hypothetical protein
MCFFYPWIWVLHGRVTEFDLFLLTLSFPQLPSTFYLDHETTAECLC